LGALEHGAHLVAIADSAIESETETETDVKQKIKVVAFRADVAVRGTFALATDKWPKRVLNNTCRLTVSNSAGSPQRMRKQTLLQRLVAGLAINEGLQPKPTEIWRRLKSLTPREVDVLCYVLGGQLNREIAAELGITETTVKVHRGRVMEKLGVQSIAQLFPMVLCALRYFTSHKPRRRTSLGS